MQRIAILIPTYNSSRTVAETLASIQQQHSGLDRITGLYLSDDTSTDDTLEVAGRAWGGAVPLYPHRRSQNGGERRNVNGAVEKIREDADWILLLHSDDMAREDWLTHMIDRIDRCDPSVATICSSWDNLSDDGHVVRGEDDPERKIEYIPGSSEAIRSTLLRGCWWHISGCAIRVQAFEDIGGFAYDLPQKGDWEWLMRCLRKGWAVEYIPRTLIRYREHSASVSSNAFRHHLDILESIQIIPEYTEFLDAPDMMRLHSEWLHFLIRRLGRSLISRQWARCLRAGAAMPLVVGSAVRNSLASRHHLAGQRTTSVH